MQKGIRMRSMAEVDLAISHLEKEYFHKSNIRQAILAKGSYWAAREALDQERADIYYNLSWLSKRLYDLRNPRNTMDLVPYILGCCWLVGHIFYEHRCIVCEALES